MATLGSDFWIPRTEVRSPDTRPRVGFHFTLSCVPLGRNESMKRRKKSEKTSCLPPQHCHCFVFLEGQVFASRFIFNAAFHTWSSRFGRCVFEAFSWAIGYTHIVVSLWKLFQLKFMNTNLKCTGKYTRISGQYFTRRFATVGSQCWSIALRIVSELAYLQKQL